MSLARTMLAAAITAAAALAQSAPCFEPTLGSNLGLGDDQVAYANLLGFTFPGPGGAVTDIDISSNGLLYLGTNASNGAGCCYGNATTFLSGNPCIAAMWEDLYPPGSTTGGVFFNTFPATSTTPARAVVTWYQVPEYFTNPPITVQVQLFDTGEIIIHHDANNGPSTHTPLVGVTQGLGATANPINFSAVGSALNTGTNPTAFEWFSYPPDYDLMGYTFWFVPNGLGGYIIMSICPPPPRADYSTYGTGCPTPSSASAYEYFTGGVTDLSNTSFQFIPNGTGGWVVIQGTGSWFTGFTNQLPLTDDSVVSVTLPWPFVHPSGITTSIDVCSNGRIWLEPTTYGTAYSPDATTFLADPSSIGVMWTDHNPSGVTAPNGIFADVNPVTQSMVITWNNVPCFGNTSATNTMQCELFPGGGFELRYQTLTLGATTITNGLVGYSSGNSTFDPGSTDFTANTPFSTGSFATPVLLNATTVGTRPVLGTTFSQDVTAIPQTSSLGLMFLGFGSYGPNGIDLTSVGMPGCFLWSTMGSKSVFLNAGTSATVPLSIPNIPALGGVIVYNQAAVIAPGSTPLGLISSNGAQLTLGM